MKISAQEEYGVRCLLQIGRRGRDVSLTIPEISRAEGISSHYVAKLLRVLRRGGLVKSARGQAGGYTLARPLDEITVSEALEVLGGRLYNPEFCDSHGGAEPVCAHSIECTIRSLWRSVQQAVDQVLGKTTLQELLPPDTPAPLMDIRPAPPRESVLAKTRRAETPPQAEGLPHNLALGITKPLQ
ncbi:MAG: Rrf2 family transcriptional regulator [Acidobacteriota bacterium]